MSGLATLLRSAGVVVTYGASLGWAVELELPVRGDVTSPSLSIGKLAASEGDLESVRLTSPEGALGSGSGDVDGGDCEGVGHVGRAALRSGRVWRDVLGNALRSSVGDSRKGKDGEDGLHRERVDRFKEI